MKRHLIYSLFVLFVLFVASADAQNKSVNTANIDFHFSNEKVIITYDIVNSSPNELYTITVSVFRKNKAKLNVVSLSGDLKEIQGGTGKSIIWEQNKDGYVLDEEIYVTLAIATKVSIPVGTHLLKSLVFPGLGDYRIRNGKYHFIYGLVGYGAIGASVYFNSMAAKNYTSYKNSFDYNESNGFFNKAKQQQSLSYLFAGTACIVWTVDLACLYGKTSKVKKQITEQNSKYYYDKGQQTNTFTSTPNFINTKLPYDLAMERGDKAFADEKYEDAKKAYEEAGKFKLTPTVDIKLETVNNKIADENRKTLEYNATIANGENLLNEKKYEEAKKSFTAASHIKPKEKYPNEKIKEIEEIQSKIENERLYNEALVQANALLQNKNYDKAKTSYLMAITYKPNDILAINKCKECDNGIAEEKQKQKDIEYKNLMAQGNSLMAVKKYEEAKAMYEQAKSLKPDAEDVNSKLGACQATIDYLEQQKVDAEYNSVMNQGNNAFNKYEYDKALGFYERALELKPDESLPKIRIGKINNIKQDGGDENDISKIYEKCKNGVFYIVEIGINYNDEYKIKSQGSGFFISADGVGVSCYHVLNSYNYKNSVVMIDKDNIYDIQYILKEDKDLDYVIFSVKKKQKQLSYLTISSKEPVTTNKVFAIGNPEGLSRRYTPGTVSGFENNNNEIAIDVSITHGSSGGPLFNQKGEVVGITSGGHMFEGGNFNVAVNIHKIPYYNYVK